MRCRSPTTSSHSAAPKSQASARSTAWRPSINTRSRSRSSTVSCSRGEAASHFLLARTVPRKQIHRGAVQAPLRYVLPLTQHPGQISSRKRRPWWARPRTLGRPPVQAVPAALTVDAARRFRPKPQPLSRYAGTTVLALAVLAFSKTAQCSLDLLAVLREELDEPVIDLPVAHSLSEVGVFIVAREKAADAVRDGAVESGLFLELTRQPHQGRSVGFETNDSLLVLFCHRGRTSCRWTTSGGDLRLSHFRHASSRFW